MSNPALTFKGVIKLPKRKTTRSKKFEDQDASDANPGFLTKVQSDLENKNALLNLILGALIVIVGGILVFNYFNRNKSDLGPATQSNATSQPSTNHDVGKNALPGNYSVKEGDTLFSIAQKYYDDGYKYPKLVDANKLANENAITVGQVLSIPKLEAASPAAISQASPTPQPSASVDNAKPAADQATGGAINETIWGEKITSNTYTVASGDWLSKIAGRAYGDIYAYDKIAKANNISNPDLIEPGTVLKIPR